MASRVVKVAIAIPKGVFEEMEAVRHKLKVSRSALIDRVLQTWLKSAEQKRLVDQYVDGYRRMPEDAGVAQSMENAFLETLGKETDW